MRPPLTTAATALTAGSLALLAACSESTPEETEPSHPALQPQPPALPRLTRAQYDHCITDTFGPGLTLPPQLEPDATYDELLAVGASVAKVSPRGVELYEEAARSLAQQVAGKPERLQALLPCTPKGPADAECLGAFVAQIGRKLWRRTLQPAERDAVVALGLQAGKALGTFPQAAEYTLVALLTSPQFLYRPEPTEPDPAHQGQLRLHAFALASRLSFFLWNGPPDPALLDAAEKGQLHDPKGLAAQVERMLSDPKLRRGVRTFAAEWLQLHELTNLNKDPKVYKHFSPDLGPAAREETLRLVEHVALDRDANFGELLTTRTFFPDRRLAAIYAAPAATETGHAAVEVPVWSERRGLLGQVSFLGLASHPVSTSPTLRGVYVRKHLLCDIVPNPPAGLNTGLPEPSTTAKTMRERLEVHRAVKTCNACHKYLDPLGLTFERFDGIAQYRATDHGTPVDTTGELDGKKFSDLQTFGAVVAQSDKFRQCVVRRLYAFAVARPVGDGEDGELARLDDAFKGQGMRLKALLRAVALSAGFRAVAKVAAP